MDISNMHEFDLEKCYVYNIKKLSRLSTKYLDSKLAENGINLKYTQVCTLSIILKNKDKKLTEIEKIMGAERTTFNRSINYLEKQKIIIKKRTTLKKLKMQERYVITEEGRILLEKSIEIWKKANLEVIKCIISGDKLDSTPEYNNMVLESFQDHIKSLTLSFNELLLGK